MCDERCRASKTEQRGDRVVHVKLGEWDEGWKAFKMAQDWIRDYTLRGYEEVTRLTMSKGGPLRVRLRHPQDPSHYATVEVTQRDTDFARIMEREKV